jgi:hypothetical protein
MIETAVMAQSKMALMVVVVFGIVFLLLMERLPVVDLVVVDLVVVGRVEAGNMQLVQLKKHNITL